MPAYITRDRDIAARNGEEAVIEYLLLTQCNILIHNGASLPRTVLLTNENLTHVNTHYRDFVSYIKLMPYIIVRKKCCVILLS